MPSHTPLTQAHCDMCNRILENTPENIELCKRCESYGYPAEEIRQTLERQLEMARRIKAGEFPHEP